jgi:hypothetical protein
VLHELDLPGAGGLAGSSLGCRPETYGGLYAPDPVAVYAYAIWTGIGTVGVAIAGMVMLGEPAGALRLGSIGLIVAGIIGLKLLTPT